MANEESHSSSKDVNEPWSDPGPTWRELQPPVQWRIRTWFIATAVVACWLAGWTSSDPRISIIGNSLIALVCFFFIDRRIALAVFICVLIQIGSLAIYSSFLDALWADF